MAVWHCAVRQRRPRIRVNTNTWSIPVSCTPGSVWRSICWHTLSGCWIGRDHSVRPPRARSLSTLPVR